MTGLLAVLALFAPLRTEVGVGLGGGLIAEDAALVLWPWAGLSDGQLSFAGQVPLRYMIDQGKLRPQDWDERADYGRLLRFLRYKDVVRAGQLTDYTLGHGTIVSRYHNGIEDDHYRTGAALHLDMEMATIDLFADHVLAAPVGGGRAALHLGRSVEAGFTLVSDYDAPSRLSGGADETGRLAGERTNLDVVGVDVGLHLHRERDARLTVYGDAARLEDRDFGFHIGLEGQAKANKVRFLGRLEVMFLGDGYDWSLFDTGYLVDRIWLAQGQGGPMGEATGGRIEFELNYNEAMKLGVSYADAEGPGRTAAAAWLRVPTGNVDLAAYARIRRVPDDEDWLDSERTLAAASATAHLNRVWSARLVIARVFRVEGQSQASLATHTDAVFTLEAALDP